MAKHITIARFCPRDARELADMEILGRWKGKMGPFSRRYGFALDGDRWRQNFFVEFIACSVSRHDGQPMMMTQTFLEGDREILAYGEPHQHFHMDYAGALYREHWVLDGKDTVILDLRAPTREEIEMSQLQDKFAGVCPP